MQNRAVGRGVDKRPTQPHLDHAGQRRHPEGRVQKRKYHRGGRPSLKSATCRLVVLPLVLCLIVTDESAAHDPDHRRQRVRGEREVSVKTNYFFYRIDFYFNIFKKKIYIYEKLFLIFSRKFLIK